MILAIYCPFHFLPNPTAFYQLNNSLGSPNDNKCSTIGSGSPLVPTQDLFLPIFSLLPYDIRVNPRPSAGLLDRPWAIPRTSLLFNQRARSHGSGFHNRRCKETGCSGYVNPRYLYSLASSYCIVGHKPPHWVKVGFGQTVDLNPLQGYPAVNNSHEL